ncbi:putative PASG [Operophtera brumata]|uniref:protein-tyrosine-phosphatase n=1 Tax=Operophtera brumata TaxID=104452 RepID=A0A0L7L4Q5_OPEBR|nr:putative PASG [Operophtera brumata]
MLGVRDLVLVMFKSAFIVAFLGIQRLYLSNATAAADKTVLRRLNITHVLTIEAHRLPKSTFENTNINTLFIRAFDTPQTNIMPYFPMANAFIEEGIQKATLVIAYLMQKYRLTYEQAYAYVRQKRRFINPNSGFVAQLRQYQSLNYDVTNLQRLEAYMNVNARKHKFKLASIAAVAVGILVPIAILVS